VSPRIQPSTNSIVELLVGTQLGCWNLEVRVDKRQRFAELPVILLRDLFVPLRHRDGLCDSFFATGLASRPAFVDAALLAALNADQSRGKREATELDFSGMFDAIDKQDVVGCGKLLVCHSFAKDEAERNSEEAAIVNLFDDLTTIQHSAYGKYQWAAYAGTFKNPAICVERYNQCTVDADALANLIKIQ